MSISQLNLTDCGNICLLEWDKTACHLALLSICPHVHCALWLAVQTRGYLALFWTRKLLPKWRTQNSVLGVDKTTTNVTFQGCWRCRALYHSDTRREHCKPLLYRYWRDVERVLAVSRSTSCRQPSTARRQHPKSFSQCDTWQQKQYRWSSTPSCSL